jgi:hypothetical protein
MLSSSDFADLVDFGRYLEPLYRRGMMIADPDRGLRPIGNVEMLALMTLTKYRMNNRDPDHEVRISLLWSRINGGTYYYDAGIDSGG